MRQHPARPGEPRGTTRHLFREAADGNDRAFYEGKVAVASFFAKNFLPLLTATRQVIENLDLEVMELDEAAF